MPPVPDPASAALARTALACLEQGGLALLPVDTVYGIAARADLPAAVESLRRHKGRAADKPLAVLFASVDQMRDRLQPEPRLRTLLYKLLPGPLTLVLPLAEACRADWPGWPGTLGVRVIGACDCSSLIEQLPWPLALSSANFSGAETPTDRPEEAFLEGAGFHWPGSPRLKNASTVVDLCVWPPRILREGAVSEDRLRALLETA